MSRLSGPARKDDPSGVVVGVHARGASQAVVVLTGGPGGWTVNDSRMVESGSGALLAAVKAADGARVVRVSPMRECLCRATTLPLAGTAENDEQSAGALALLAEAELPATLKAYRRGAGVIGQAMPDGSRHALLTGWAGSTVPEALGEAEERWATPVAALAALWGGEGVHAGYVSGEETSIALIVLSDSKLLVRVSPLDDASPGGIEADAAAMARETCEAAQAPVPAWTGGRALRLDGRAVSALRARVPGVRDDAAWLDTYGLALGAALLAGSSSAVVSGLARMTAAPPRERLTVPARVGAFLAEPRRVWLALAAAVVLVIAGPLAFAWGRSEVLGSRVRAIESRVGGQKELERKAALYAQLEQSRWPMAKLLSDISTVAPVGVSVTSLRMTTGQDLNLRGMAKSQELVTRFSAAMVDSKLFSKATINRTEFKESGVDFDMTAQVGQPFIKLQINKDPDLAKNTDYAAHPLAVRLYGEGASNDSVEARTQRTPRTKRGSTPAASGGGSTGGNASGKGAETASTERRPSPSDTVPPAMSDEQIAKLDQSTAMTEWVKRKTYVQKHPTLDAPTKQRLEEEWPKIQARYNQLKGGGT